MRDTPSSILCVDDDRNLCQILSEALGGEGYAVRSVFDGEQALAELAKDPPDIVLLDLILPRKDGFAVLDALRAMDAPVCDLPVVLITGCSPTPQNRERAKSLGVAEFLTKPVPLSDLLAIVARYAGEQKPEDSDDDSPRPSERIESRSPGLSGSLDDLPLPALFHHLHGLRATGVLHLANGKKRKWIQFRDGYPRAVRSNLINECLGNHLVRDGAISQAAFAESRRRTKPGRLQGEILVAMEIMSEEEISDALRAQADEKLFEAFSWKTGTYRFERGAGLERANSLGVERSPANLILRGVRERFPIEIVEDYICSHADCFLAPAENPFYQFQEVDLDSDHEELLASLDGTRRLAEFLKAAPDLKRTLYAMLAFGLLELRGGGERTSAKPSPRRDAQMQERVKGEELRARLTGLVEQMRDQSYFEILGVDDSSSEDEIRVAFQKRAARLHPDQYRRSGDAVAHLAGEVFDQINVAYQTLTDPRRRSEYELNQRKDQRDAARQRESEQALEAEVQFQEGQRLLAQRAYERALVAFGRALELYPDAGEYHAHYGWTLHLCHPDQPDIASEAIEHVRRGIKLAGQRETSYLFLGRLCKATGRVELAERMFARAVQLEPGCVEALRELRLINLRRYKSKGLIRRLLRR
ncbi:MAG: response regulator [Deltaproteobacteria bacterium]|nr:response regulator [Deltaproteobacteria bacterium]